MSQIRFNADITSPEMPLLAKFAGRAVLQQTVGEGKPPISNPTIVFGLDILPTKSGYKSVSYTPIYGAISPATDKVTKVWTVSDPDQTKAKLCITSDSKVYILTAISGIWYDITPAGWTGGDAVTLASVAGSNYLYFANFGCYVVSVNTLSLTAVALTGITPTNIAGCFSSINYLCLFDATTIYWCSTVDPTDFTPSLITGAGSATPDDLDGQIVAVSQLNNGYAVYTTANIIIATYSNNTHYPWIFVNANNGSGIASVKQLSTQNNLGFHVALTFAGILQVTAQGCVQIVPELSEFLAAQLYETFDSATNTLVTTPLDTPLKSQIAVIGARYVALSYAPANSVGYTQILIRDLVLNRWGRLSVNHAAIFDFDTAVVTGALAYINAPLTYADHTTDAYNQAAVGISTPPALGNNIGILGVDGSLSTVTLSESSTTDSGVLLLGKYQATRNYTLSLQGVTVETVNPASNFTLHVIPTLDGKTLLPAVPLTRLEAADGTVTYGCRVAGRNYDLLLKGSFRLTAVEITAVLGGRR